MNQLFRFAAALVALVALVLTVPHLTSCSANAPRSIEDFAAMPEPQFQAWMIDVQAWGEMQGATLVMLGAVDAEKVRTAANDLRLFTAAPSPADMIAMLRRVGVRDEIAVGVVMAGTALLQRRGGWPTGERLETMLDSLATGLEAGAAAAMAGEGPP